MTVSSERKKLLAGLLVFGNAEQVKAVNYLGAIEELARSIRECTHGYVVGRCIFCGGDGWCECTCTKCHDEHEVSCEECHGTGLEFCNCINCGDPCIDEDMLKEALTLMDSARQLVIGEDARKRIESLKKGR